MLFNLNCNIIEEEKQEANFREEEYNYGKNRNSRGWSNSGKLY